VQKREVTTVKLNETLVPKSVKRREGSNEESAGQEANLIRINFGVLLLKRGSRKNNLPIG